MTEHEVLILGYLMFEEYGVDRHWRIQFEDSLPRRGGGFLAAHTSWDERIVRLCRKTFRALSPMGIRGVLEHEIAHIHTPQDWTHGDIFNAKLEDLRACRSF